MQGRSQRCDLGFLRFGLLAGSAHCDEGILDFPEGHQDGLLVLGQGLSRLRFGCLLLEAPGLGIEERRGQAEAGASKGTAPEGGKLGKPAMLVAFIRPTVGALAVALSWGPKSVRAMDNRA
jgi:hypothetical protein